MDDLLRSAPPEERASLEASLHDRFDCKESQDLPFTYLGMEFARDKAGLRATMLNYIERMPFLRKNTTFDEFASLRAMLLWVSHVRPDVAAFVSIIGSVTATTFLPDHVASINRKVQYLKSTASIGLVFPKLDVDSLRLVVYTDGSFANRDDKTSQIGFVTCLTDKTGRVVILSYRSCKSWRVCRSAMASETLAFVAGFDTGFTIRAQISEILQLDLPLLIYTDSKCLFDVMTTAKKTTEGRLMINIFAARQSYRRGEINNICLIRSNDNLADDLTKLEGNGLLLQVMHHGYHNPQVVDYIMRPRGIVTDAV